MSTPASPAIGPAPTGSTGGSTGGPPPPRRGFTRRSLYVAIALVTALGAGSIGLNRYIHRPERETTVAEYVDHTKGESDGQVSAQLSSAFSSQLDQITKDHLIRYTTDSKGNVDKVYATVNSPNPTVQPCDKYDSLSAITDRLYGKEKLPDHKQHITQLVADNYRLVGKSPDLVLPGNMVDITSQLTQVCSADELNTIGQYFNQKGINVITTSQEVEQANHARMKFNGSYHAKPCDSSAPAAAHRPVHATRATAPRPDNQKDLTTPSFSAAKPDDCRYVTDINADLDKGQDSATRNRYDNALTDLSQKVADVKQLVTEYSKEGFTQTEVSDLLGKYNAIGDVVGRTLTELKGVYDHMVLCATSSGDMSILTQPNAKYLKDTVDALKTLSQTTQNNLSDLERTLREQNTKAETIAATPSTEQRDPSMTGIASEQYNIMVGKDKKHVTSLDTALAELKVAGIKKGLDVNNLTPVIVYNEKTPFVAYDQKGHPLELHRVAVDQDALLPTEQVTFDKRAWGAYEDRHGKGNDHFTLSEVVDGKGKSVKFKMYNKPEVAYKAPVEGHEKDHFTINGAFSIPNLMVLTTEDGDRLAYIAVAPHTSRGDYMKMMAMDAAFFGFGNVAGNYWDFNILHPFGGGGGKGVTQLPPDPFNHNFP